MWKKYPKFFFRQLLQRFFQVYFAVAEFFRKVLACPKMGKNRHNSWICLLLHLSIMAAFFIKIGLLDLSHILHEDGGP